MTFLKGSLSTRQIRRLRGLHRHWGRLSRGFEKKVERSIRKIGARIERGDQYLTLLSDAEKSPTVTKNRVSYLKAIRKEAKVAVERDRSEHSLALIGPWEDYKQAFASAGFVLGDDDVMDDGTIYMTHPASPLGADQVYYATVGWYVAHWSVLTSVKINPFMARFLESMLLRSTSDMGHQLCITKLHDEEYHKRMRKFGSAYEVVRDELDRYLSSGEINPDINVSY